MSPPQAGLPDQSHSPPPSSHHNASDARATYDKNKPTPIDGIADELLLEIFKYFQLEDVPIIATLSSKFRSLTQHILEPVLKDLLGGSETITPSLMSFLVFCATNKVERHTPHVPFRSALHRAACRMTKMYISLEYASEQESEELLGLLESFLNFCFPLVSV